jgi:ADP-heptose:LPS heptosyltransferase
MRTYVTGQYPLVAPLAEPFDQVNRIAVLRGGGIGDALFALPAVQSLAAAYPDAEITMLGTPAHAELLAGRPGGPTRVVVVPPSRGVRPGPGENVAVLDQFFKRMVACRFDLAVQAHGGGRWSNPFLLRLAARHTIGTRTPDAAELERSIPYIYYQNEMMRALEIVSLAGARPVALEPRLAVRHGEAEWARHTLQVDSAGLVVVHPGATDARRRWPVERFADVVGRCAEDGLQVILIGDASDAQTCEAVVAAAALTTSRPQLVRSVAGMLTLSQLVGVLGIADVVLGSDSGPRHLAGALGTRTVGIYWCGNAISAGPAGRSRHRVHISWVTNCPECGRDCTQVGWTAERCEHDVSFVADVQPDGVYADIADLLAQSLWAASHGQDSSSS